MRYQNAQAGFSLELPEAWSLEREESLHAAIGGVAFFRAAFGRIGVTFRVLLDEHGKRWR
jgi:hypothetical protein